MAPTAAISGARIRSRHTHSDQMPSAIRTKMQV
jgi:hypothetical protein